MPAAWCALLSGEAIKDLLLQTGGEDGDVRFIRLAAPTIASSPPINTKATPGNWEKSSCYSFLGMCDVF